MLFAKVFCQKFLVEFILNWEKENGGCPQKKSHGKYSIYFTTDFSILIEYLENDGFFWVIED